jgi:hypothetical protein
VILDQIVSHIDVFPTLDDLAGLPRAAKLDGESLWPLLTGKTKRSRDSAVSVYTDFTSDSTMFMLRRGDWKYVAYPGYGPQLFNLRQDPEEIDNQAKAQPAVAKEMDAALRKVVDYDEVYRRVIAYDKASFRAWRNEALKGPVPNFNPNGQMIKAPDGKPVLLTYQAAMAAVYRGWGPEHEAQIRRWLDEKP